MMPNLDGPSSANLLDADTVAIREALSPSDRREFDAEYQAALDAAKTTYSLEGVHQVVEQWRRYAMVVSSPGAAENIAIALRSIAGEDIETVPVDWTALA